MFARCSPRTRWRYLSEGCYRASRTVQGREAVEDALLGLVRDLLPQSPAAQWDTEWAHALCKDALARLAEYYAGLAAEEKDALDLSGQDVWDEQMRSAGLANDPTAFRRALKGWERAGLEAIERVQVKGGAA